MTKKSHSLDMGAMFGEEEENWRESEDSLEFAVLEAAIVVERASKVIFSIREGDGGGEVEGRRRVISICAVCGAVRCGAVTC